MVISEATSSIACHMFLLSMDEGHKGKRELASCLGDVKLLDLGN